MIVGIIRETGPYHDINGLVAEYARRNGGKKLVYDGKLRPNLRGIPGVSVTRSGGARWLGIMPATTTPGEDASGCTLCGVKYATAETRLNHIKGNKHKKKVEAASQGIASATPLSNITEIITLQS